MSDQQEVTYERLGEKKLTVLDAIAQSVGFIGPVFSAAFLIPLIAGFSPSGKGAGIATPFAVLLASIGTFALGWIVAQYAKRIHAAGSLYDYVSNGLGVRVGGWAGWIYYGGTTVLASAIACLIGFFMEFVIFTADPAAPGVISSESPLPAWGWSLIFVVAVFLIQYLGVRISVRLQLTLALVSIVAVLAFFVKVILDAPANDVAAAFNPNEATDGWTGILFGVLYGVLIFVGFETAANLAEETAQPKRAIPRAVLTTVVIAAVFYLVASYAQVAGFGFDAAVLTDPAVAAAPLFALASPTEAGGYGSDVILDFIIVVVFLDVLAVGIGAAVASSHGVFALARDRRLPGFLAAVSGRGTPVGAIAFVSLVSLVMVGLAEYADDLFATEPRQPHFFEMFLWLSTFGAFAIMSVYALMCLGAFRGLRDHPRIVGIYLAALVGFLVAGAAIYGAIKDQPAPNDLVWKAVVAWAVLGLVVTFIARGRAPARRVIPELATSEEAP